MTVNAGQRQQHAHPTGFGEARLDALQRHAFEYFLRETNRANGLVADKSEPGAPASIAAVGFALAVYPVGVTRAPIGHGLATAARPSPIGGNPSADFCHTAGKATTKLFSSTC